MVKGVLSFWKRLEEDQLRQLVSEHSSFSELFDAVNMAKSGDSYNILKKLLSDLNISYIHFTLNKDYTPKKVESFLVNGNRKINSDRLKKKLIKEGFLENSCSECKIEPFWNGKPLSFHLDHINGNSKDNRLNNLRILCPNCHSQTATYSGKKLKKIYCCKKCMQKKDYKSKLGFCRKCNGENQINKFNVSKDDLYKLLMNNSVVAVAKMFNVSDNAIRKRAIRLGIQIPKFPKGYWIKSIKNNDLSKKNK